MNANRKHLPKEMKNAKLKKGQDPLMWKNKEETLLAACWQDTGRVNMLASSGTFSTAQVKVQSKKENRYVTKPSVQVD